MPPTRPAYSSDPEEIARLRAGFSELDATYTRLQSDHLQQTSDYTRLQKDPASLKRDYLQIRHPLEELKRWVFGSRSERFVPAVSDPDQGELFPRPEPAPVPDPTPTETRPKAFPRKPLPAHLPRTVIVLEPEGDLSGLKCIGQEVTETLNWIPGRLEVMRRVRPKYVDPGPGRDHRSVAEAVDLQEYGRTRPDGCADSGQVHRPLSVLPVPGPDQSGRGESLEGDRQRRVHDDRPVSDAIGTSFARGSALRRIPPGGRDASQGTGSEEEGHHAPHLPLGVLRTRVPSGMDGLPPDAHAAGDPQRLQRCFAHGRVHGLRRLQRASGCMAAGCMRGASSRKPSPTIRPGPRT